MTAFPSYSTGTVAIGSGATTVVGTGSNWTGQNAMSGDLLVVAGNSVIVQDVTDALALAIDAWPFTAVTAGTAYKLYKVSPLRFAGGQAMADVSTLVAALNTDGFYVFVGPDLSVPDPSYGNDDQYAFQATTGKLWQKTGGTWNFIGTQKGFGLPAPWSSPTAYLPFDVASLDGTSYVCILANTNETPPNATYWTVLAAKGDAGHDATIAVGTVTTGAGGSAAAVTNSGTPGTAVLDFTIPQGRGYVATSTTSLAIGTGSKAFTTQSGLAYTNGARVRASSAAGTTNWMEGLVTYSGTTLTITVTKTNGSGTHADWNLNLVGEPGAGDLSSSNNLSDLANAATARTNLGSTTVGDALFTTASAAAARTELGSTTVGDAVFVAADAATARTALGVGAPDIIIEEQQPSGTQAGAAAATTWTNRNLNTMVRNVGSLGSFASGACTLPAGTYYFQWSAPSYLTGQNQTRLQNTTDNTTAASGTSEYAQITPDGTISKSTGSAVVTITGSKAFSLQHWFHTARTLNGMGLTTSAGITEVYSRMEITKIG